MKPFSKPKQYSPGKKKKKKSEKSEKKEKKEKKSKKNKQSLPEEETTPLHCSSETTPEKLAQVKLKSVKTRRTTGGSHEEKLQAVRDKRNSPKTQRSEKSSEDMHIDESGNLKNIPKLKSTLSRRNSKSEEKASSEMEQAFSKINKKKPTSKYDELSSRLDSMMEEASRKREERKIADAERRERRRKELEEEEREYKLQLELKWLRKQEQLEEDRKIREERRRLEELQKSESNSQISKSMMRANERADALLKRFSFQSQDTIPEEEEEEETQENYVLQDESFYSTRSKLSSYDNDDIEPKTNNTSAKTFEDPKLVKLRKTSNPVKQDNETQPMDMLLQIKFS